MAARSTSRFKRKPAVPFGDFMLPILGVIALGIVVMGIRMLWAPTASKTEIVPQPRVVQPAAPVQTTVAAQPEQETQAAVSSKEAVDDVVLAKPETVAAKTAQESRPNSRPAVKQSEKPTAAKPAQQKPAQQKPKQQAAQPKTTPAQPKAPAVNKNLNINKSQFIVQCGSFSDNDGANAAVAALRKIGYKPVVRKADVRGKNYYRVVVAGGDREQAEAIEADIKQKTNFPTLVRSNAD